MGSLGSMRAVVRACPDCPAEARGGQSRRRRVLKLAFWVLTFILGAALISQSTWLSSLGPDTLAIRRINSRPPTASNAARHHQPDPSIRTRRVKDNADTRSQVWELNDPASSEGASAITDVKPIDIHDTSAGKYDSYVKKQVAKLNNPAHHDNIKRNDKAIIEAVLHRRFVKYQSSGVVDFKGKHTVGVGLNPGEKNPHVLLGDAHSIGFAPGSVEILYSNVLDHILNLDNFVEQVAGVLSGGGLFLVDLSKKAVDEYAVHDFRKEKAVFMNLLQSHFTIVSELDESQPESVWFIVAKRKVRNDGKIGSADAVLVVGDGLSAVSSKAVELREKGAFVVAMSPDVSKDKVVLACSTDISSSAFAQVVEVGSGGKACGMAVVTTPAADAGSLLLSTTTQTSPESPASGSALALTGVTTVVTDMQALMVVCHPDDEIIYGDIC